MCTGWSEERGASLLGCEIGGVRKALLGAEGGGGGEDNKRRKGWQS